MKFEFLEFSTLQPGDVYVCAGDDAVRIVTEILGNGRFAFYRVVDGQVEHFRDGYCSASVSYAVTLRSCVNADLFPVK